MEEVAKQLHAGTAEKVSQPHLMIQRQGAIFGKWLRVPSICGDLRAVKIASAVDCECLILSLTTVFRWTPLLHTNKDGPY